jgi:voltage-gated potassium channel Kch
MKTNGISAIPAEHQEILTAVIIVSIMMTPILVLIYDQLLKHGKIFNGNQNKKISESVIDDTPSVIICGFVRMGQIIAQMLETENISYVAIDANVDEVVMARESGYNVIYGESRKKAILLAAGFKPTKTKAVVISLNDEVVAQEIVHTVKSMSNRTKIFARARNLKSSRELLDLGVKSATPEIIESSFIIGANLMAGLGLSQNKISNLMKDLRANNYENVKKPIDVK